MTGITPEMLNEIKAVISDIELKDLSVKTKEYAENPDKRLQDALDNHNTNMVRSILKLDLSDSDVQPDELKVNALYIAEYFPEQAKAIFEPFVLSKLHKDLETDTNLWDEDYFLTHKSYLTLNFAIKRLFHLAKVKQKLIEEGKLASPMISKGSTLTQGTKETSKLESAVDFLKENIAIAVDFLKKNIGIAITVIGVAVAVAAYALV